MCFSAPPRHPPPHSNPTTELISPIPPRLTHVAAPFPIPTDHISLPAFAINPAGAKVWTASYLPFGEVLTTTGTPIALRFPGQWFQGESGLHQNWMRDYDPTTGRYVEADPIGLVDGASIFTYVKGNPGRWVDPKGEQSYDWNQPQSPLCMLSGWGCIDYPPQMCTADEDEARCQIIYEKCRKQCIDYFVEGPFPGRPGKDQFKEMRKCIRTCMVGHGCYNY